MGYKISNPDFETALNTASSQYAFALVYEISDIKLCRAEELSSFDWSQSNEARFFNTKAELHLFFDEKKAITIEDTADEENFLLKEYQINEGRFPNVGKKLIVKQYIKADEDGQCCIALTRLAEVR